MNNDDNYPYIREMTIRNSEKLEYIAGKVDDIDDKIRKCVLPRLRRVDRHDTYFKLMGAGLGIVFTLVGIVVSQVV